MSTPPLAICGRDPLDLRYADARARLFAKLGDAVAHLGGKPTGIGEPHDRWPRMPQTYHVGDLALLFVESKSERPIYITGWLDCGDVVACSDATWMAVYWRRTISTSEHDPDIGDDAYGIVVTFDWSPKETS